MMLLGGFNPMGFDKASGIYTGKLYLLFKDINSDIPSGGQPEDCVLGLLQDANPGLKGSFSDFVKIVEGAINESFTRQPVIFPLDLRQASNAVRAEVVGHEKAG
jgi:hypothetical protein